MPILLDDFDRTPLGTTAANGATYASYGGWATDWPSAPPYALRAHDPYDDYVLGRGVFDAPTLVFDTGLDSVKLEVEINEIPYSPQTRVGLVFRHVDSDNYVRAEWWDGGGVGGTYVVTRLDTGLNGFGPGHQVHGNVGSFGTGHLDAGQVIGATIWADGHIELFEDGVRIGAWDIPGNLHAGATNAGVFSWYEFSGGSPSYRWLTMNGDVLSGVRSEADLHLLMPHKPTLVSMWSEPDPGHLRPQPRLDQLVSEADLGVLRLQPRLGPLESEGVLYPLKLRHKPALRTLHSHQRQWRWFFENDWMPTTVISSLPFYVSVEIGLAQSFFSLPTYVTVEIEDGPVVPVLLSAIPARVIEGETVTLRGVGLGDSAGTYGGVVKLQQISGITEPVVLSWETVAASGVAYGPIRTVDRTGRIDPEHQEITFQLPMGARRGPVWVRINDL